MALAVQDLWDWKVCNSKAVFENSIANFLLSAVFCDELIPIQEVL
jgi:hypothetical protein